MDSIVRTGIVCWVSVPDLLLFVLGMGPVLDCHPFQNQEPPMQVRGCCDRRVDFTSDLCERVCIWGRVLVIQQLLLLVTTLQVLMTRPTPVRRVVVVVEHNNSSRRK